MCHMQIKAELDVSPLICIATRLRCVDIKTMAKVTQQPRHAANVSEYMYILTWLNHYISRFPPVLHTMSASTITDSQSRSYLPQCL